MKDLIVRIVGEIVLITMDMGRFVRKIVAKLQGAWKWVWACKSP